MIANPPHQTPAESNDNLTARLVEIPRLSALETRDRKSTRLNSSHGYISYAVFCLKKKNFPIRLVDQLRRKHPIGPPEPRRSAPHHLLRGSSFLLIDPIRCLGDVFSSTVAQDAEY